MADGLRAEISDNKYSAVCAECGTAQNLMVCSRCRSVWYCSKQHQNINWKRHKLYCKKTVPTTTVVDECQQQQALLQPQAEPTATYSGGDATYSGGDCANRISAQQLSPDAAVSDLSPLLDALLNTSMSNDLSPPFHSQLVDSDVDLLKFVENIFDGQDSMNTAGSTDCTFTSTQSTPSEYNPVAPLQTHVPPQTQIQNPSRTSQPLSPSQSMRTKFNNRKQESSTSMPPTATNTSVTGTEHLATSQRSETKIVDYVVQCLNNYGICVLDHFMGEKKCMEILKEVCVFDVMGFMTEGMLVDQHVETVRRIREDKITWVEKDQNGCQHLSSLIHRLDLLVMQCNGQLEHCNINGRTKVSFLIIIH